MNSYKQKILFKTIFGVLCFLSGLTIASIVYGVIKVYQSNDFWNNFIELIAIFIHILFLAFEMVYLIDAIRHGSQFCSRLCVDHEGKRTIPFFVIAILLIASGVFFFIYNTLIVFGVPLHDFTFPIMLILALANVGLNMITMGLMILLYPIALHKDNRMEVLK